MKSAFIASCVLVSSIAMATATPSVFVAPRADANKYNPKSGRVVARLSGGKFSRLSRTAKCWDVKAAPGGKSWAWIEGQTVKLERDPGTLFPTAIVVWRNAAPANSRGTVIRPEKTYEVVYQWVDDGHIAVGACGRHGAVHLQLFDARSGKCVEKHLGYEAKLPGWAQSVNSL
jgi:hypothetical protein